MIDWTSMVNSVARVLAVTIVVTITLASAPACSLLTSLDGFTDRSASAEGGASTGTDASRDATTSDANGGNADGAVTPAAVKAYFDAVLADGPIAFFHFDETSGPSAKSVVGGVKGTYQGRITFGAESAIGAGDTSVSFDGSSARIDFGDVFAFSGSVSYSLECWVKPNISGSTRFVFDRRTSAAPFEGYTLYFGTDFFLFARRKDGAELGYANQGSGPTLDVWTHVVTTFDGNATSLYINGQKVGGAAGAGTPIGQGPGSFVVGDLEAGQYYKFSGQLDELSVYDKSLTAAQVLAHFTSVKR